MAINKMNNISLLYNLKRWLIGALAILMTLSCTQDIENLVGPSFSGYTIGITAQYGGVGIVKASGSATRSRILCNGQWNCNNVTCSRSCSRSSLCCGNSRKRKCHNNGSYIKFLTIELYCFKP